MSAEAAADAGGKSAAAAEWRRAAGSDGALGAPPPDGGGAARPHAQAEQAGLLLDALEAWLREQTIESVLPKASAKALLADLRDDRRFWAQQRKQFNVLWVSIEEGMRREDRPLSEVLGPVTSGQLLDAIEEMDDDPALVNSILRSEVVERLLGHVLYEGIFEFVQRADLLGNIFNTLPVIGAIRMQMLSAARKQLDSLLGEQVARFLGEYTASAAENAARFLLSDDTADLRRKARRKAAKKLLDKPIQELFELSEIEMALVRDAVWSAVQEFRLPNEGELVDRLYLEFGAQPFTILLPTEAIVARGDAPLFVSGRAVMQSIIERFLASGLAITRRPPRRPRPPRCGRMRRAADAAARREPTPTPTPPEEEAVPPEASAPPEETVWDGWD